MFDFVCNFCRKGSLKKQSFSAKVLQDKDVGDGHAVVNLLLALILLCMSSQEQWCCGGWIFFDEGGPVNSHFTDFLCPDPFLSDRCLNGQIADEMVLKWEVFVDGLKQFWALAGDPERQHSPEFYEEEQWVLSDERDWPFAFANLCEVFGLQVDSVRTMLLAHKNEHSREVAYV